MELRLKKRIVGFALLVALGLIVIPLFFGHSVTSDELQLSSHVPNPPAKPGNFSLSIPAKEATVPAIASTAPAAPANGNAPVIFEQTASTTAADANNAASPAQQTVPVPAVAAADKTSSTAVAASSPASTATTSKTSAHASHAGNNVTTNIHTNTATTAETATTATHKTSTKTAKTKPSSTTNTTATQHKSKPPKPAAAAQAWAVQLGVFSDKINAENLMKKLQSQGFSAYLQSTKTSSGTQIKVLVGPELRKVDADSLVAKLQKVGNTKGIVVKANI